MKKTPTIGYIYWHNTQWNYFLVQKLKNTLKSVLVPTWSNGRCVAEVRIHLILARLSFALLWQAVDSAAYA